MRALAAVALFFAAAAPASAATVAHRTPEVGPAFAGGVVMWGEEARSGALRIMSGAPGRDPVLVHRIAPATDRKTSRGLGEVPGRFAASSTAFVALLFTSTITDEDGDSVSSSSTDAVVGGPLRGPARVLSGCIPARGDLGCGDACGGPEAVDVDGDRIAIAETRVECGASQEAQSWITVTGGGAVLAGTGYAAVLELALAGRFLAWIDRTATVLVVRDLESGTDVVRLSGRDLGIREFDELALQPDGTVAFTYSRRGTGYHLGWTAPGAAGVRTLDRDAAYGDLALAGRRVVYERILSESRFTGELVVRTLAGGPARRLAFFPERRRRVGDLDFDGTRATWAEQPTRRGYDPPPRGPARIVVRSL